MNIAATVTVAGLLKPEMPSCRRHQAQQPAALPARAARRNRSGTSRRRRARPPRPGSRAPGWLRMAWRGVYPGRRADRRLGSVSFAGGLCRFSDRRPDADPRAASGSACSKRPGSPCGGPRPRGDRRHPGDPARRHRSSTPGSRPTWWPPSAQRAGRNAAPRGITTQVASLASPKRLSSGNRHEAHPEDRRNGHLRRPQLHEQERPQALEPARPVGRRPAGARPADHARRTARALSSRTAPAVGNAPRTSAPQAG